MGRADLAKRLNDARVSSHGCQLNVQEVMEITDSLATMAGVIQALNTQALKVGVPPEALADTVMDCLCFQGQAMEVLVDCNLAGYRLTHPGINVEANGPNPLSALDQWRHLHGKPLISGVEILIPGDQLYAQLLAKVNPS